MIKQNLKINGIPLILWGELSDRIFLYIHGQGGYKEEAESFASIACERGWQVLSNDLPEHGQRKNEINCFNPWHIVPELRQTIAYAKQNWSNIALCANSIGAWFSMLSFAEETLEKALFVSPILDMCHLIENMMLWENVSANQLQEYQIIPTTFGQTLSWEYYCYAKQHNITNWDIPTSILYADKDNLTERSVVDTFVKQFKGNLTIVKDGEHWFHTTEQLTILEKWTKQHL